nr:hypothetical protein [Paenibacillus elgii]
MALSLLYPTLMTYISFVVSEKVRGYSIGWFIAAADFGTSSGAFVMGWLADAFTYRGMLVAAIGIGIGLVADIIATWAEGGGSMRLLVADQLTSINVFFLSPENKGIYILVMRNM